MTKPPQNTLYDGWLELKSVNGADRPLALSRDQVHKAINCSFRNGEIGPRPGFHFRRLVFNDAVDQMLFNTGRWQAAMLYRPLRGDPYHLVMKGGRLYRIDLYDGYKVTDVSIKIAYVVDADFTAPVVDGAVDISLTNVSGLSVGSIVRIESKAYEILSIDTPTNTVRVRNMNDTEGTVHSIGDRLFDFDLNDGKVFKNWTVQAEQWALFQDGRNRCLIYNGSTSRRAGSTEVPPGSAMAYGLGRLWVATPDGYGFSAGDLVYGSSGDPARGYRDSILKWTENSFLAGGGRFSVPTDSGPITGMRFIANLDVVLGQGPLQVFTEGGSFSVRVPANRSQWNLFGYDQNGTLAETAIDPIQTVSLLRNGSVSDLSIVANNSDFFFRSIDGIRTFQLTRRQFGTWANTPISRQVRWAIDEDPQDLLLYGSAVMYDGRYLCLCAPQLEDRGVVHKGMVSMDFDSNEWTEDRPPTWDGLWTFSFAYQIIGGIYNGNDRCFVYTRNVDGEVELYELDKRNHEDQADADVSTRIRWAFESSEIAFPTENDTGLFNLKSLYGAEVRTVDMENTVGFIMRWKPDRHSCWFRWADWEECCPIGPDCGIYNTAECRDWTNSNPQSRSAMGIPQPADVYDSVNCIPARNFYTIQIRVDVRGYCRITGIRLAAKPIAQPTIAKTVTCQ